MNKKGADSTGIIIFTFLVLTLIGITLFSFIQSVNYSNSMILGIDFIDSVYIQEDRAIFNLNQFAEIAFLKTYNYFLENGKYIKEPSFFNYNGKNLPVFSSLELDENFKKEFKENLKAEFRDRVFEDEVLNKLKLVFGTENFEVSGNTEKLFISEEGFIFTAETGNENRGIKSDSELTYEKDIPINLDFSEFEAQVNYRSNLLAEVDVNKLGLDSFEELYEFKESCSAIGELDFKISCYNENKNKISNFNINVIKNNEKLIFEFESKKEFLIDDTYKNIKFSFVVI